MRPRRTVVVLSLVGALWAAPAVAGAATGSDRKKELQQQIGEASQAENAALLKLAAIQNHKASVDAKVNDLDAQQTAALAKLAPLDAEAKRLTAEYTALQAQVAATQAKLDEARAQLAASAADMYRSAQRATGYGDISAAQPTKLIERQHYLDRISDKRKAIIEQVKGLRHDLVDQRKTLEKQKAVADAAAAEARTVRDQIAQLRAEIEPARAELASQQQAEAAALEDIRASKAQSEAELAALQATSDSIGARLRALGNTPGSAGPCQARPVPGAIVSGFGPRYHPILHYTRMHTGADMSASSGTPIHACRGGTVVIASAQGGYGNAVVINHGGGMATLYAHQSRIAVSVGQVVTAGQVIGYVGSTGLATGPHLHFEVRLSGNPVNPASYL
jgi:murein DD-endopeptidase MepM/ murein hydrolase activator NlpD